MKTTSIDGEHLEKGKGANKSFVDPRTARALKAFPLVGNLATRKSTFSGPSQVNTEIGVSSSSAGSGSSSSSSSSSKIVTLNTTIPSRKSLQKMLCATGSLSYVDCQPHCERELTSTLPLIFAPPGG